MGYNHFLITGFLTLVLSLIFLKNKEPQKLYKLLTALIILNLLTFNIYLLVGDMYNYKIHLPFHLCYLTQLGILISIIFRTQEWYPWLLLNSVGGGLAGFLNSNLDGNSQLIEHWYLYLSHFNLLLFSIFLYKTKFIITKSAFLKSVLFNSLIFMFVILFNINFDSNYWFTSNPPPGINLSIVLPEWPYGLFIIILLGLVSYYFTFKLFSKNKKNYNC